MTKCQGANFLRHIDSVRTGLWTKSLTAATELRCRLIAVTSPTGALLLVHFLARDRDFRAVSGVMRTRHPLQGLIAHHAVDQVWAWLKAKNRIEKFNVASFCGVECGDSRFHHAPSFLIATRALKPPGLGVSL